MKAERIYQKCHDCPNTITGQVKVVDGNYICFKCFVARRVKKREEILTKSNNWVIEWIRLKKYFCDKCSVRKSDVEVSHGVNIHCIKCGSNVVKIVNTEFTEFREEYLRNLERDGINKHNFIIA